MTFALLCVVENPGNDGRSTMTVPSVAITMSIDIAAQPAVATETATDTTSARHGTWTRPRTGHRKHPPTLKQDTVTGKQGDGDRERERSQASATHLEHVVYSRVETRTVGRPFATVQTALPTIEVDETLQKQWERVVAAFRSDGTADKGCRGLGSIGKDFSRDVVLEPSSCIQSQSFWTRPTRFDQVHSRHTASQRYVVSANTASDSCILGAAGSSAATVGGRRVD